MSMLTDLQGYTFDTAEKNQAAGVALAGAVGGVTNVENLRNVAIQSIRDAAVAVHTLTQNSITSGGTNEAALEAMLTALNGEAL